MMCAGDAARPQGVTMHEDSNSRWMPALIVSDIDQERLSGLANAAMKRLPEIAEELMSEVERATVVSAQAIPPNVVQMGSMVEFKSNDGQHRRVELVFPAEADISLGKISVLTPIGTALIGLSEGQSIMWTTRDGREQELTVVSVSAPSAAA
jgi:regulator of nucleoside diphosphate kinase